MKSIINDCQEIIIRYIFIINLINTLFSVFFTNLIGYCELELYGTYSYYYQPNRLVLPGLVSAISIIPITCVSPILTGFVIDYISKEYMLILASVMQIIMQLLSFISIYIQEQQY